LNKGSDLYCLIYNMIEYILVTYIDYSKHWWSVKRHHSSSGRWSDSPSISFRWISFCVVKRSILLLFITTRFRQSSIQNGPKIGNLSRIWIENESKFLKPDLQTVKNNNWLNISNEATCLFDTVRTEPAEIRYSYY